MSAQSPESQLSRFLRRADPLVDDPGLSPSQTAEMRRTVLARVPEKEPSLWPQLSPAVSVAALLALALGAAWWPSATDESPSAPLPRGEAMLTPGVGDALENRQIQFETPGGTLVVWVLNPNFPS